MKPGILEVAPFFGMPCYTQLPNLPPHLAIGTFIECILQSFQCQGQATSWRSNVLNVGVGTPKTWGLSQENGWFHGIETMVFRDMQPTSTNINQQYESTNSGFNV